MVSSTHPTKNDQVDEVALLVGGASFIARHTALALSERGARIAILDQDSQAVADAVAQLEARGARAKGLVGRPYVADEVTRAIREAASELGRLTTVVILSEEQIPGEIHRLDDAEWNRCIEINLHSAYLVAKHAIPYLVQGGGSFTALTSTASVVGLKGTAASSAAMHGLVGMIKSMALDYARQGVRCNVISCGVIDGLTQRPNGSSDDNNIAFQLSRTPVGRPGAAADVANLIAHLSSPDAAFTSGAVHTIDGGMTAGYLNRKDD